MLQRASWMVILASLFVAPATGAAPAPGLSVGEVTSEVARQDVDFSVALRSAIEQELPGVELSRRTPARPAVLSMALVQLERSVASPSKASVTCVVTATLRDKKRGAIVAVIEGRARAENEERLVDLLERTALKSAVRGAMGRIPEALDLAR